jgi:hypothetical protein
MKAPNKDKSDLSNHEIKFIFPILRGWFMVNFSRFACFQAIQQYEIYAFARGTGTKSIIIFFIQEAINGKKMGLLI